MLELAADEGFAVVERTCAGQWVHGWARGEDERWPCFLERRQAINWMADTLRRGRIFA